MWHMSAWSLALLDILKIFQSHLVTKRRKQPRKSCNNSNVAGTYKIRPKQKQPPRIYGVPKIHITNAPLRPIVSCVNTLAYDLSGHLARILSPLTGNSNYTVKNSGEFANIINRETIQTDEVMISFDVESLLTNVLIEETVEATLHRLNNDPSLQDRTALTPTQIADPLNLVLRFTYFKYNGALYEQQEGAPMGSPISALIADLYMEAFDEQTLATAPEPPRIWKRYIDYTFTVMKQHNADNFLSHLSQQHPSIRFTMETENNNKIAFLDSLVTREPDGKLLTSVYRKRTHTDQYLAYDSHRPQSVKRGIVKCLHDRAKHIITKPSGTAKEKKYLSTVLVANGYPPSFLQKVTKTRNPTPERETAEFKYTAVLPYIKGVSEPLRRHLQQQGIRTVFKSDTTLRSRLVLPKDPADPNKQGGVVYKIPCTRGKVYIGETGRPMQERMKEHDRDIRLARTQNSAVSEHANGTGHKPLWNETKLPLVDKESVRGNLHKTQPKQHKQGQRNQNTGSEDAYNKKTSKPTTHEKPANAWGNHGTWKQ